jgi:hypothetical protein
MRNEGLIKNYTADGAIGAYRIVKFGSADGNVAQASAATDLLIGVTGRVTAEAANERVDVIRSGIAEVEYGGNVTRGKKLTANADGKAIEAAPSDGDNVQVIGIAEVSGVSGDIGSLLIAPGVIQGETVDET